MDYPRYDPASPVTPLTTAELDALDALLRELPADGAMSLDGLDGYLTALLVGPPAMLATLTTGDWLPLIWGGDDESGAAAAAPFASKRQRKAAVVLVLRHLRHLSRQLDETPDAWEPIFSIAEQGAREWADARDWCTGFLQAVDLMPAAWGSAWEDPALAPVLWLGGGLEGVVPASAEAVIGPGRDDTAADVDDLAVCDRLSRAVPEAVLGLLARRGRWP